MSQIPIESPRIQQAILQDLFVASLAPEILQALIHGAMTNPDITLAAALRYFPAKTLQGYKLAIWLDHTQPKVG